MALGAERRLTSINQSDTAELRAYLYDDQHQPIAAAAISAVTFSIRLPDGTTTTPASGTIQDDGAAFYRYVTSQIGEHIALVKFTLVSGEIRSSTIFFYVDDPLEPSPLTGANLVVESVWNKLEDCFDSEDGGPWLRDMTLAYFNPEKLEIFISEAIFDINMAQPSTETVLDDFTRPNNDGSKNPNMPLLTYGVLLKTIRHLMRSYVEQPDVRGANVVYEDRRDYLQRWQSIYTIEKEAYERMLALWKRQFLNLGQSALLVGSKAGRLYGPGTMRLRNAGRGRYW